MIDLEKIVEEGQQIALWLTEGGAHAEGAVVADLIGVIRDKDHLERNLRQQIEFMKWRIGKLEDEVRVLSEEISAGP